MKLRIEGNSLRLRLKRPEVETLARIGRVEDGIVFGSAIGARLDYVLEAGNSEEPIAVQYGNNRLIVRLPGADARDWASNDRVGFEGSVRISDEIALNVLIEKDFKCLHDPGQPAEDGSYANPDA